MEAQRYANIPSKLVLSSPQEECPVSSTSLNMHAVLYTQCSLPLRHARPSLGQSQVVARKEENELEKDLQIYKATTIKRFRSSPTNYFSIHACP